MPKSDQDIKSQCLKCVRQKKGCSLTLLGNIGGDLSVISDPPATSSLTVNVSPVEDAGQVGGGQGMMCWGSAST